MVTLSANGYYSPLEKSKVPIYFQYIALLPPSYETMLPKASHRKTSDDLYNKDPVGHRTRWTANETLSAMEASPVHNRHSLKTNSKLSPCDCASVVMSFNASKSS